jgi:hypothetical protein
MVIFEENFENVDIDRIQREFPHLTRLTLHRYVKLYHNNRDMVCINDKWGSASFSLWWYIKNVLYTLDNKSNPKVLLNKSWRKGNKKEFSKAKNNLKNYLLQKYNESKTTI